MNLIASTGKNWEIGKNGDLLFRIQEDMEYFKKMTLGKVVVMGRKTFESLPSQQPLKNRINVVLTRDKRYHVDGACCVVHSKEEAMDFLYKMKEYGVITEDDIFVIGGAQVYRLFLNECTKAYITRVINVSYPEATAFLPDLKKNGWFCKEAKPLTRKSSGNVSEPQLISNVGIWINENYVKDKMFEIQSTYTSILSQLRDEHIFAIDEDNGNVCITELCDGYYDHTLTKQDCLELAKLFADLAKVIDTI